MPEKIPKKYPCDLCGGIGHRGPDGSWAGSMQLTKFSDYPIKARDGMKFLRLCAHCRDVIIAVCLKRGIGKEYRADVNLEDIKDCSSQSLDDILQSKPHCEEKLRDDSGQVKS